MILQLVPYFILLISTLIYPTHAHGPNFNVKVMITSSLPSAESVFNELHAQDKLRMLIAVAPCYQNDKAIASMKEMDFLYSFAMSLQLKDHALGKYVQTCLLLRMKYEVKHLVKGIKLISDHFNRTQVLESIKTFEEGYFSYLHTLKMSHYPIIQFIEKYIELKAPDNIFNTTNMSLNRLYIKEKNLVVFRILKVLQEQRLLEEFERVLETILNHYKTPSPYWYCLAFKAYFGSPSKVLNRFMDMYKRNLPNRHMVYNEEKVQFYQLTKTIDSAESNSNMYNLYAYWSKSSSIPNFSTILDVNFGNATNFNSSTTLENVNATNLIFPGLLLGSDVFANCKGLSKFLSWSASYPKVYQIPFLIISFILLESYKPADKAAVSNYLLEQYKLNTTTLDRTYLITLKEEFKNGCFEMLLFRFTCFISNISPSYFEIVDMLILPFVIRSLDTIHDFELVEYTPTLPQADFSSPVASSTAEVKPKNNATEEIVIIVACWIVGMTLGLGIILKFRFIEKYQKHISEPFSI